MEKIIFKDNSELSVTNVTPNTIYTTCAVTDISGIYDKLTEANLEEYRLVDEQGHTLAIYTDKKFGSLFYDGDTLTITLGDVDVIEKRIKALENTADLLTATILEG